MREITKGGAHVSIDGLGIAAGKLSPGDLVTGALALEEVGEALASMEGYTTIGIPVIDRY